MGVEFSRAIVVSRTRSDANVYDVTTKVDVDATLSCRGDEFLRFEARIGEPARARDHTDFERFQAAALKAALGWDAAKSRGMLKGMSADAHEFLDASRQRGDVYIAGKTEEHEPGGVIARPDGDRFGPDLRHRRSGRRIRPGRLGRVPLPSSRAAPGRPGAARPDRADSAGGPQRRRPRVVGGNGRGAQRPPVDLRRRELPAPWRRRRRRSRDPAGVPHRQGREPEQRQRAGGAGGRRRRAPATPPSIW